MIPNIRTGELAVKKNKTHNEYVRRINMAIEYIKDNADKRIKLNDIARASHFSAFHFHRIFHAMVGETVNDYVARKKMEKMANTLICKPGLSVTEVAESGGFSSSANFSKAFKLYFGVSPSQIRNPHATSNSKIGKIYSKYGKAFDTQALYSQFVTNSVIFDKDKLEEMLMNIRVESFEEKAIAYLTAPHGYDLDSVFDTWDKMIAWAKAKGVSNQEHKRFAILHDNPMITPVDKCRYDASIEIDRQIEVVSPFTKSKIPAGQYAVAHYQGEGEKISHFFMELYSAWLPNSGFEPGDFPPVAHYLNDSREDGFVEMEVHIKLKALENS